jgi:hypothetical protein
MEDLDNNQFNKEKSIEEVKEELYTYIDTKYN